MAKVNISMLDGISGKVGNSVFVNTRSGPALRAYIIPRDPRTPAQTAVRNDMRRAALYYRALTPAQLEAWRNYAAAQARRDPFGNPVSAPNAYNLFTALTRSFLQARPHDTPPNTPPSAPFFGDVIGVTAAAAPGSVLFTASAPNSANIETELLLQPLANAARLPLPREYRSRGFALFAAGSLTAAVTIPDGAYTPAYRFFFRNTGQKSALVPLPNLTVTG